MKAIINKAIVDDICSRNGLCTPEQVGRASIRQFVATVSDIEQASGQRYIRMEMGVPGLRPSQIGIDAECEAMKTGIAAKYPDITGIRPLKEEASRFIKAFINLDIPPLYCIPTVGSMQGAFVSFAACLQADKKRDTVLFIDPGFPVQKQQIRVLGYKHLSFDVYAHRGEALGAKLEEMLAGDNIAAVIFSNPNNPTWMCLDEDELRAIAEVTRRHNTIVIEDLAYLNMDFRSDLGKPFQPPYQASIARYTDLYIMLLSSSKIFSYAGQRGALVVISPKLYDMDFEAFKERYGSSRFGQVFIHSILYTMSAGVTHSVQYAMAAMFRAASDGRLDFVKELKEYERRAHKVKELLRQNGFHIVYDKDKDVEVGDGFFFTFGYKDMTGQQLISHLLYYGISAIPLDSTGSRREGVRACVSNISDDQFAELESRLKAFDKDFK